MAEIAGAVIDGTVCELCGGEFIDPEFPESPYTHGHPAVCATCWSLLSRDEKKDHQKAIANTI